MHKPLLILLTLFVLAVVGFQIVSFVDPVSAPIDQFAPMLAVAQSLGLVVLLALLWTKKDDKEAVVAPTAVVEKSIDRSELEALRKKIDEIGTDRDRIKKLSLEQEKSIRERIASAGRDDVLGLLGLLQEKGRFVDFIMDDVAPYTDQQIGSAARVVHGGCAAVIKEYFRIAPVFAGSEGGKTTLGADFDSTRYRLMGKLQGEPPFTGTVVHRGWQADEIKLPERVGASATLSGVIAPAEVEIS